jgi:hypothetical protein
LCPDKVCLSATPSTSYALTDQVGKVCCIYECRWRLLVFLVITLIERRLPVVSTYLGYTCVRDTYWYLSACPELMQEAARRLDQRFSRGVSPREAFPLPLGTG